jgi:hypothetical protein
MYYQTTGTAPNRVFTLQMTAVHSYYAGTTNHGGTPCDVQVKFFETTNVIQILYKQHSHNFCYSSYPCDIGLDGFNTPSQDAYVFAKNQTNTPSTDIQFSPVPPSQLSLQPKSITFAPAPIGFVQTQTVTATSVGTSPLHIQSYSLTGASDYSVISGPQTATLTTGNSVQWTIQFSPTSSGSRFGQFTVISDGKDSGTQVVNLNGNGLAPNVQFSTNALFHRTNVPLSDTSGVQYVGITNIGTYPLHINSTYFIGLDAADYIISRYPASVIQPDVTDSIGIRFTPRIEGRPDASLVIASNALNIPWDTVSLFGVGTLERLVIDSAYSNRVTLNFDSVAVGVDSCLPILLYNPGSDTLKIFKDFFTGADYDFSFTPLNASDSLIPPGQAESMQVCFKPLKRGYRTAALQLVTGIPRTFTTPSLDTSDFLVTLIGTGVPSGNFQIAGPDHGDTVAVGTTACQVDTLMNTGAASLTVTSVTISGVDASQFSPDLPTLPFVLAAGARDTFTVCGTPTIMGDRTATITGVATVGERSDTTTLPIDVFGTSDSASAAITTAFPASTCVGESSTGTVTVTNIGNTQGNYTVSLTNQSNAPDFQIIGSTSSVEAPNGTATFTVSFTPTTNTTPETATFTISDGANPVGTLALSAQGGAASITGTGIAPLTMVGTSDTLAVTVSNATGTCDWTPGTPTLPAGSMFSYISGGATPITAGGTGTLTFAFTPTSVGSFGPDAVTFSTANGEAGVSLPAASVTLSGTSQASGVADVSTSQGYSLEQNTPNPFSGKSQVKLTLPESGRVQLVIVDLTGKVLQTVLDKNMGAGTFQITLDASELASGTYYYQLMSGGVTLTRQMMVIK